jgi:hypothetical protein
MIGEIATINLSLFDKFVSSYRVTTSLASEALEAFDQFLPALYRFFDIWKDMECNINGSIITIKWYGSAVISSGDTIRAMSNWYHQSVFDNISINMDNNEIENYITYEGMCFGKVSFYV